MAIDAGNFDTSIYQAIKPIQADIPSVGDSMERGMKLSQLGLQMDTQRAMRDAYSNNVGQDGQLNQQGYISDISRVNPMAGMSIQKSVAEANKLSADAQTAKMQATHAIMGVLQPKLEYLAGMSEPDRERNWNSVAKQAEREGVPLQSMGMQVDQQGNYIYPGRDAFRQYYVTGHQTKEALDNQLTQANIGKTQSETAMAPVKRNSELYGSRSPNAELTSQFNKDISPVISSQMAMRQMIDNYKNPSPQGDASLLLNAFKIKFPTAPDVNSLEELSKSQAASDTWKNMAHKALEGGLDANTRDNLMRDGISTFRANYGTYKDTADRYRARQAQQNVNDPTLTYQPGIENTFKDAMALQDKVGPYVPPAERGGLGGAISKMASNIIGGKSQKADNDGVAYAAPQGGITEHDARAMKWLKTADQTSPDAFAVRAKLKQKGLLK